MSTISSENDMAFILRAEAAKRGWRLEKVETGETAFGMPDLFAWGHGQSIWIELKRTNDFDEGQMSGIKSLENWQVRRVRDIDMHGGGACIVYTNGHRWGITPGVMLDPQNKKIPVHVAGSLDRVAEYVFCLWGIKK